MSFSIFAAVFATVIIFSFFSTLFAIQRTKKINVSQVLRFEG